MAADRHLKCRLSKLVTVRLVNPLVRPLLEHARLPGWALLETTGRRSGLPRRAPPRLRPGPPRRAPLGDGLGGETFWIVTEHGWSADYVKNIQADPHVR